MHMMQACSKFMSLLLAIYGKQNGGNGIQFYKQFMSSIEIW